MILTNYNILVYTCTYISLITMTNKSVMTFISVNKISVCLSVCTYFHPISSDVLSNTRREPNFGSMLGQRRRHWVNIVGQWWWNEGMQRTSHRAPCLRHKARHLYNVT